MMRTKFFLWGVLFFMVGVAPLQAAETWQEALMEGTPYIDARYRYEFVDQDTATITEDANASTLRTRLGYKTGTFADFSALFELENVLEVGNDDYYNKINNRTDHPLVADVENTEINQVFVKYTGLTDTTLQVGRQVIALDAQRFIGPVRWRQGDQTFDGVTLVNKSIEDTVLRYGYIANVNRIFGDKFSGGNWESNSHYYNFSNTSLPIGKLVTYGYFLNFQQDSPANSSKTFGVSLSGKRALNEEITLKYYGEYAQQQDFGDNTTDYDATYFHVAPAVVWKGLTTTVGFEVFGSDNSTGFRTPLATGHKFNGWADKFLVTPNEGLEDLYVDITYKVSGMQGRWEFLNGLLTKVQYHDFDSNQGDTNYGSEWDAFIKKPINKHVYVEAKYAHYSAQSASYQDTRKFTFGVGVKY